jgi:hypothetical protein
MSRPTLERLLQPMTGVLMAQRDAGSIWPHLPSGTPNEVQQHSGGSIADAVYGHLRPPPKQLNPYLDRVTETEWRDYLWALAGLKRKR